MSLNPAMLRGKVSLPFALLTTFLGTLWLAGGGSRPGLWGQVVVRMVSWTILIVAILWVERPRTWQSKPVALFLGLTIALVTLQIIPLPPAIWLRLPGRSLFAEAANVAGQAQPWRPLAIVPGAAWNALSSLVVPLTTLTLASCLRSEESQRILSWILMLVVASMIWAMLQFAGLDLSDTLVNQTSGAVSASFANRNHLALLLAIGCIVAPAWACLKEPELPRLLCALALDLLFVLAILATGSRAGLLLCALSIGLGAWLSGAAIRRAFRSIPLWLGRTIIVLFSGMLAGLVALSFALGRAVSINRLLDQGPSEDMRAKALPTLWHVAGTYFPAGIGFGSFDPVFRVHEPLSLLNRAYLNHAHNDFLEIVIEGGLAALLLLLGAVTWWLYRTVRVGRLRGEQAALAKLGSAIVLVVMVASVFDYPARTPMIMALAILAAFWLGRSSPSALRSRRRSL